MKTGSIKGSIKGAMMNKRYVKLAYILGLGAFSLGGLGTGSSAWARDIRYSGAEQTIYVTPGEPTQIVFPSSIEGGFKRKNSSLALERKENFLVVFAQPEIPYEGEALLVQLDDKRSYALRISPADDDHPRDEQAKVIEDREDPTGPGDGENDDVPYVQPRGFAPATVPSGLIREMMLVAEFGKQRGIPGYRRTNRYSGETVINDGAIQGRIDEIFMGPDLWGYVVSVENLLDTNQKINPATFRLDGTRAVGAERWELAPRPVTAEQKVARHHQGKIYIVTKAQKR